MLLERKANSSKIKLFDQVKITFLTKSYIKEKKNYNQINFYKDKTFQFPERNFIKVVI